MLAIFSMTSVSAQEFRHGFSWGIKSGANLSTLITESKILQEDDHIASRWGYTGGGFINYRFSRRFMLSFDILFSGKGFKADLIPGITDAKFRLNYLDLPVLANFYVYKGLALKVGLQPSILLNANVKGKLIKKSRFIHVSAVTTVRYLWASPMTSPTGSYSIYDTQWEDTGYSRILTSTT